MLVTVVMIIALFCSSSLAIELPPVPCPDVFKYEFDGEKYFGIITVRNVSFGETTVKVAMEQPGNEKHINRISMNLPQFRLIDYISGGQPITYRVDFQLQNVLPRVTDIMVNNVTICSDEKHHSQRPTFNLKHTINIYSDPAAVEQQNRQRQPGVLTLSPTITHVQPQRDPNNPNSKFDLLDTIRRMMNSSTVRVIPLPKSNGSKPTIPPYIPTGFNYIDSVCGKENNAYVKTLVVNGKHISKSRFPWIVAIFTQNNTETTFLCGGSLISTKTVVSAAHCFYAGFQLRPLEDLLLSMGRHDLNEFENAVNMRARKLITHPDYRPGQLDADVAIIQLERTVSFNIFIRPICLWQGSSDVSVIEGSTGVVVGWGEDETHTGPITVPKLVNATIVSELDCIKSHVRFYYITSSRTLCAGNRDGRGPCLGDSGSGLMILSGNRWMLRGAVSASLSNDAAQCNVEQYAVYSDIAKFIDWINSNMLL